MTLIYFHEEQLTAIKKQRKKLLTIFYVVLGFYVLITAGMITWNALLPYASSMQTTVKIIEYVVTAIVIIFLFVFMGIPYKRTNKIYKFCKRLSTGVRETSEGSFFEYDEDIQDKDGVDCKSLIFIEWNKYKNDYFERKVLVFYEQPFPEIPESAQVRFVTQGNFLIEYEILEVPEKTENETEEGVKEIKEEIKTEEKINEKEQ